MSLSEEQNQKRWKELSFLEDHGIPITIQEISEVKLFPNRIVEILMEQERSPLLEPEDITVMNLRDEQHWFQLLRGEDQPEVFGPTGCLFEIADWLGVSICDIYGMCFQNPLGTDGNSCDGCKSEDRWRNKS